MNKTAWILLAIAAIAGIGIAINRPNSGTSAGIKQRMIVTEENIPKVIYAQAWTGEDD